MGLNWNKGRTRLFRFDGEAFVVLTNVDVLDEAIGRLFGFDAVQAELIAESALKSSVDPFATASGLGRVSGNGADAQFCESAANLSKMALKDFTAGFGSEEEVASPVGVEGAEDAVCGNAVAKKTHTAESAFFIDEFHLVNFARGIIHENEQIKEDIWQIWEPLMGAPINVEHHSHQRSTGSFLAVLSPRGNLLYKASCLQGSFDECVAASDIVMFL